MIGLALFNVFLPLGILRLVALRRPWTLRLMMALPVAAAVPLTAFVALEPLIPALPAPYPASTRVLFTLGSLAGIPIVCYAAQRRAGTFCDCDGGHRRSWSGSPFWRPWPIGLVWLRIDTTSMPAIEHYAWSGWYLAVLFGAYAIGILIPTAWVLRGIVRLPRRSQPSDPAAARTEAL